MGKYYLTDYLLKKGTKLKKGMPNLLVSPCGSGKTSFILSDKGLIKNTTAYIDDDKILNTVDLDIMKHKILYICDTTANKEKMARNTGFKEYEWKDYIKAAQHPLQYFDSIECKFSLKIKDISICCITYAFFINLLTNKEKSKYLKSFKLIILDEIGNLFKYSTIFDNDEDDKGYFTIAEKLEELSKDSFLLGMTATPQPIAYWTVKWSNIKFNNMLTVEDREHLISYIEKEKKSFININNALSYMHKNKSDGKFIIYTDYIRDCETIKDYLTKWGYKVEYLCNEKKLSKDQKKIRKYLLLEEKIPDELDGIIFNGSLETGINICSNKCFVDTVIINSTREDVIIQARNRYRGDLNHLYFKGDKADIEKELKNMPFTIDEKYIGKKLDTDTFKDIMIEYGIKKAMPSGKFRYNKGDFIKMLSDNGYEYRDNMIINENEFDIYLEKIVGKILLKEEREELINKLNVRKNGRLMKSITTLNSALEEDNSKFYIISKRIKINGEQTTAWIISSVE